MRSPLFPKGSLVVYRGWLCAVLDQERQSPRDPRRWAVMIAHPTGQRCLRVPIGRVSPFVVTVAVPDTTGGELNLS